MKGLPFAIEPWALRETELHLDKLGQTESLFALSNGHIGLRGNLDEGEPHALPGSYLNGFYELRSLPYAEAGYGYPESGQTVINVTNGKIIRLLAGDEPFDVRYGILRSHERVLDFRDGVLRRSAEWVSPAGRVFRVESTRIVSFTHRAVAAFRFSVTPLDGAAPVTVQSELIANEELPTASGDPRVAAQLDAPLRSEIHGAVGPAVELVHTTRASGLHVAAGMHNAVDAPVEPQIVTDCHDDIGRVTITASLGMDETLTLTKYVGYGWSSVRSIPAVRDQVIAAVAAAHNEGWDRMLEGQREYLDEFWDHADVEVDGDEQVQQAVRFALFHILQASARGEGQGIPAKGLTGPGYDGHAFWDTEAYVLPVLNYTAHRASAHALAWRHDTLPMAKDRAAQLRLGGAAFPWRTINGEECSGYWPAGTAAFHIGADIAAAVSRCIATDPDPDRHFERAYGLEILVETARMWRALGHFDLEGEFRLDGVTGPDEYSAVADNNIFTNLMAQQNLRDAADVAARNSDRAKEFGFDADEIADWNAAADAMRIPFDEQLGIYPQAEGFTRYEVWDFEHTTEDQYPLLLNFPYFDLYRKQVVKQADLVMALFLRGDAFTPEEKLANFDYYEGLTVRDSSLSPCIQAIVAAEVGHLELAHDYLHEAALMDLADLAKNTGDGLHLASLAGTWLALVNGMGGLRDHGGRLSFRPRMPSELRRIAFTLAVRGTLLHVELSADGATYSITDGPEIEIDHEDEAITVAPGAPVTRPLAKLARLDPPSQPAGRAPRTGALPEP